MKPFTILLVAAAVLAPATARAAAPGATTSPATDVTYQSATLNGVANPNKEDTTYHFEYGTTTAYGSVTPNGTATGNAGKSVSAPVTGLASSTTYHFRLVVVNASGTDSGSDVTFTTPASPYALPSSVTIGAAPSAVVFGTATAITGTVTGPQVSGVPVQLQATPAPFTAPFADAGTPVTTDASGNYAFSVVPGLITRYRVVAQTAPPATSPTVDVAVATRVSFKVSKTRVRRGRRVRFSGSVAPAHDGQVVRIQRRTATGAFKTVARVTLRKTTAGTSSAYAKRLRIRRKGTYRVRKPADADHTVGTSRTRTIRVSG